MVRSQLLSVFALFILLFFAQHVFGQVVNFADSVLLTMRQECAVGEMELLRVRTTDHIPRTVATRVGGMWEPAESYRNRIHQVSASSVKLSELDFNDNDGAFEFICKSDGRVITIIQLTVIFPYDVSVSEGDTARIPCYFPSEGLQAGSARWERDGELVLVQPEGRLSVPPDWVQTGDFSLTVKEAQLQDGGSYVCYTGKKTRGRPEAVKVTVQRSRPAPTAAPQQPTPDQDQDQDQQQTGPGLIVSMILNVLLFTAAVSFCSLWRVSERNSRREEPARRSERKRREGRETNGVNKDSQR